MSKQQDKLWNDLSEEKKKEYRKEFQEESESYDKNVKHCDEENGFEYNTGYSNGIITTLEELFGEHNLNPKLQIKTWEDFLKEFHKETDWNPKNEFADLTLYGMDDKIKSKIIATAKIAKLIDLGYGGNINEEEWRDIDVEKWCIIPCNKIDDIQRIVFYFHSDKRFIAFHTEQQAEEFMSHESNRKLVEQYYMM